MPVTFESLLFIGGLPPALPTSNAFMTGNFGCKKENMVGDDHEKAKPLFKDFLLETIQNHSGVPKHVSHLVCTAKISYVAVKTTLKVELFRKMVNQISTEGQKRILGWDQV